MKSKIGSVPSFKLSEVVSQKELKIIRASSTWRLGFLLNERNASAKKTLALLEHSSPNLTNKVYTNIDPLLRKSINQLPLAQWLQG